MIWSYLIPIGLIALIVGAVFAEYWTKKGSYRRLSDTQPDARTVNPLIPHGFGQTSRVDADMVGKLGAVKLSKDEEELARRAAQDRRKEQDQIAEKRNRIRPWDKH